MGFLGRAAAEAAVPTAAPAIVVKEYAPPTGLELPGGAAAVGSSFPFAAISVLVTASLTPICGNLNHKLDLLVWVSQETSFHACTAFVAQPFDFDRKLLRRDARTLLATLWSRCMSIAWMSVGGQHRVVIGGCLLRISCRRRTSSRATCCARGLAAADGPAALGFAAPRGRELVLMREAVSTRLARSTRSSWCPGSRWRTALSPRLRFNCRRRRTLFAHPPAPGLLAPRPFRRHQTHCWCRRLHLPGQIPCGTIGSQPR